MQVKSGGSLQFKVCSWFLFSRMESAYRMWIKERREGLKTADSAEVCRELQSALGTAKWQVCDRFFFLLN